MDQNRNWAVSGVFILGDILMLWAIFFLAALLREILTPLLGLSFLIKTGIAPLTELGIFLGIGTFLLQGLYPGYGLTAVKEMERMSKSITMVFILLAGVSYLNKPFQDFPRSVLLIAGVLALGILPITHFLLRNLLSRTAWYGVPVIIFGEGEWAREIERSLLQVRRLGWRVKATSPVVEIDHLAKKQPAQIAILALNASAEVENYARNLSLYFNKVVLIRRRDNFGSMWVEPRDLDGRLGLEFHYHLLEHYNMVAKHGIDFVGALLLLILLSPFLGLLAVLITLDSPGPVFFRQERIGQNFKTFNVLKFRTMVINADQELQRLVKESKETRSEYEQYHKLKNDPRVTRIGRWLRCYSLDEFPQLWNVLSSEMSLVGPRAYLPSELKEMETYTKMILRVKPGMTGWWQVMGRNDNTFQQRLQMDEHYISNWSMWMDIYILLKTIQVVLSGSGT